MREGDLERWLHKYADAWERRDPDAAAELFTETAAYHVTPFRTVRGRAEIREYWADATADQREIEVETEVIAVDDGYGVGRFVTERLESGDPSVIDGVCIVTLADSNCSEFREWWHTSREH